MSSTRAVYAFLEPEKALPPASSSGRHELTPLVS